MTSKTTNKFSPEVRTRAVRMVLDHQGGTTGLAASAGVVIVGARLRNSSLDTVMQEEGGSLQSADTLSSNNKDGGPASPSVVSAACGGSDKVSATITGGVVIVWCKDRRHL